MMSCIESVEVAKCLVLDKRIGLLGPLKEEFSRRLGITVEPFIAGNGKEIEYEAYDYIDGTELPPYYLNGIQYPTWYSRPNPYNAYRCHQKILLDAVEDGFTNILMVEDDTFLEDDFEEVVSKADEFLSKNNWDMIYFGAYHHDNTTEVAPNVVRLNGSGGWHCVLLKTKIIADLMSYGPIGPFDWICGEYLHKKYDCYCIYPCVASQRDGYSFIEGGNLSKPSRFLR